MFRRLWRDDRGAVVSVEYCLVVGIVAFGGAAGLVRVRDAMNANLYDAAESLRAAAPVPADVRTAINQRPYYLPATTAQAATPQRVDVATLPTP